MKDKTKQKEINKIYKSYKNKDTIDGLEFKKKVEIYYKKIKNDKPKDYDFIIKKRYNQLINSISKPLSFFVLYITILIPIVILDKNNMEQFGFCDEDPNVCSYLLAILFMIIACIIIFLILYLIIAVIPFSKNKIKQMNEEIEVITSHIGLRASKLADKIDRKKIFIKTIIETFVALIISAILFGVISYFK